MASHVKVSKAEQKHYELVGARGGPIPLAILRHGIAWVPVQIQTPEKRWVWGKRYTRWLGWDRVQGKYLTTDVRLGWVAAA